ncbi:hypothetical protein Aple_023750 [Acrocarpospora pleiomorpha]|uniref:ABC3 transporter permease C-terminal domain-containing protein n=1 Tax=Acrocarpospora pleiomorpha TaxID=90975 RepID=A0A5M3XH27_9ACTN|nr:FtsX-like permease family protein [Acrocarpospora pleiomorpha]GES19479.1 hypothetical protein Aple_023750 [Acrocarpospora pleiomorpha]
MKAVRVAVRAAVAGRRVQTLVVGVVTLLSTATAVLGTGLLVVSDAPFAHAFAHQAGAHAAAYFDPAQAGTAALTATAHRPGVTVAAGPFDAITVDLEVGTERMGIPVATVVGRAEQLGAVDRLTLDEGRWLTGPGQIVLARHTVPPEDEGREVIQPGQSNVTVNLPGTGPLRVVGIADSITNTGDAWVWPTQDFLDAAGGTASKQMLYRFSSAADATAVQQSLAAATATLPKQALLGSTGYLSSKLQADSLAAPMAPFVVAFAVLGILMSVLIVANVVNGAVVAGFHTIGILKSLGFTPGQVVSVYIGQILLPGIIGASLGAGAGNMVAAPVLGQAQRAFDVTADAALPPWVWLVIPLAILVTVGLTAAAAAWRAGRISAVQAISMGRAPRVGRGHRIRRRLAATRLPRPVSFGLGTLSARPVRSVATLLAVLIGAASVVFAVGLTYSLSRAVVAFTRVAAVPIDVQLDAREGDRGTAPRRADPAAVRAAIDALPGTAHVVGTWDTSAGVTGVSHPVSVTAYDGEASWVGYELVSGRWYLGPGEVVAGSRLLSVTGAAVGDTLTLTRENRRIQVSVVGEGFVNGNEGFAVVGAAATLAPLGGDQPLEGFEIALTDGTDPHDYREALDSALTGQNAVVEIRADHSGQQTVIIMISLVATLTLLLSSVAALAVFNTVVLNTRERIHEIGVLKSLGMTPYQIQAMVITAMAGVGLIAGLTAVPLGWFLHRVVLPVMGNAAGTGIPDSIRDIYPPGQLVALAAAGVPLAVLGALIPATWAARTRPATALRAE